MNPHQSTPIGLSVKDAAILTSVGEKDIRDEINAGRIPAYRRGRRILIDHEGLLAWFRSHEPVTTTKSA